MDLTSTKLKSQFFANIFYRSVMETHLQDRDRVGVQDAVLLEDYTSEVAFVENLQKRFKENLIYVSRLQKNIHCVFYFAEHAM
jgi:hypothetical protein